jgi:hypothetical protein
MTRFRLHLPGFVVAVWVMAAVVVAIAYGLCMGTAEAAAPPPHKAPPHLN